jgi:hypothetical protein
MLLGLSQQLVGTSIRLCTQVNLSTRALRQCLAGLGMGSAELGLFANSFKSVRVVRQASLYRVTACGARMTGVRAFVQRC